MNLVFIFICLIHILIWAFILLAFLNKKFAYINIIYIIPFMYILHILPFHILMSIKKKIYKNNYIENQNIISKKLIIPNYFGIIQKKLSKYCTFSPLSPQGMLIFGAITSSYRLLIK